MNAEAMKAKFATAKENKQSTGVKLVLKALEEKIPYNEEFVIFPASTFSKKDLTALEKLGYEVEPCAELYEKGIKISLP